MTIVTECSERLWPRGEAVGKPLVLRGKEYQVVGVVPDYRLRHVGEPVVPKLFIAFWQSAFAPQVDARVAVRVEGDPAAALPVIRRAAASADRAVPVTETLSMRSQFSANFVQVRLGGAVLVVGAALALFLSAMGLYGVVSFRVTQRQREIGVRLAVGARPADVVRLIVRQGLTPIWIGGAIGLVAGAAAAPLLSQWLFGVAPLDAGSMVTAALAAMLVALLASYLPARRAARTDPAAVFRCD